MRKDINLSPGTVRNMAQAMLALQEGSIPQSGPWTQPQPAPAGGMNLLGSGLMDMVKAYTQRQGLQQQYSAPGVATAQSGP